MRKSRTYRKAKYIIYRQTVLDPVDHLWTFLGGFVGIGIIGFLQSFQFSQTDNIFLIGSFGASAVLIYGASNSPLAQPRNLVGGHVISALIGICCTYLISAPQLLWLASALAVSFSIVAMQITKTMHPPGGATALIAVIGSDTIKDLGFFYILSPVLSGVFVLLLTGLFFNNLSRNRNYPYR
jgi:CBS-domain-containing membrane protein